MPDDEFAKQASNAIQATVAGAAGLVSGPAGVVLAVGAAVTFSVFDALAARNDEALREFRVAALEGEMVTVLDKLRSLEALLLTEGKKPDRQDPLTQNAVASEFVRGVTEARTVEKRTAMVNATVAQFDPRKGSPATRAYWLGRVREAPEGVIALVNLLIERRQVAFFRNEAFETADAKSLQDVHTVPLPLPVADVVAFETLAQQLNAQGAGQLVYTGFKRRVHQEDVAAYNLTAVGTVFASFIRGD